MAAVAQEIADPRGNAVKGSKHRGRTTRLGFVPIYDTPFQPVPLWDRGCMKKCWVERTEVCTKPDNAWFREYVEITAKGYFWIGFAAWVLIVAPASLAFIVSYFTPRICLACRSLTFTVYASCQTVLIIITTLRAYFYRDSDMMIEDTWAEITRTIDRIHHCGGFSGFAGVVIFLLAAIATIGAICGSIFTGFAATLIQIIGGFRNCKCNVPASKWLSDHGDDIFNIATDTQDHRDSSIYWSTTGIAAISFMAAVCYAGWWYQRYLRRKFEKRVTDLKP